jgi:hypothetical protein
MIELLTYLFSEVVDGRNAATTDGVRQALGRDPRDFADYARSAAATGRLALGHRCRLSLATVPSVRRLR